MNQKNKIILLILLAIIVILTINKTGLFSFLPDNCVMAGYEDCWYKHQSKNVGEASADARATLGLNTLYRTGNSREGNYLVKEARLGYNCEGLGSEGTQTSYIIRPYPDTTDWLQQYMDANCDDNGCGGNTIANTGYLVLATAPPSANVDLDIVVYIMCWNADYDYKDGDDAEAWAASGYGYPVVNSMRVIDCFSDSDCSVSEYCQRSSCTGYQCQNNVWLDWSCQPNLCYINNVNCANYCTGNTLYLGNCNKSSGQCSYQSNVCEFGCGNGQCLQDQCLYKQCDFGCQNGECINDPCSEVNCQDYCDSNILYYGNTCDEGQCVYQNKVCEFGCKDGKCLSNPCNNINCEDKCDGNIRKTLGVCQSDLSCKYTEEICAFGCNENEITCLPETTINDTIPDIYINLTNETISNNTTNNTNIITEPVKASGGGGGIFTTSIKPKNETNATSVPIEPKQDYAILLVIAGIIGILYFIKRKK